MRSSEAAGTLHLLHLALLGGAEREELDALMARCEALIGNASPLLQRRLCHLQAQVRSGARVNSDRMIA
jgi:hypothetical protein